MHHHHHNNTLLKQILITSIFYVSQSPTAHSNQDDLMSLSVEDLLNIEVISVAKKAKSLNDSPAAIYVITQEDIKRIGATSIPEALRLAPGIDVARIDSNKWAVSARGFIGRFSNKLLVLIDGRNAYVRSFAGVYWENQDVMLEDVERIEVIRGPGATLWGANAVNGVINIITKHSSDTQGGLLVAGGGTEEKGFGAFRYGGELNEDTTARVYIKGFKRGENTHESGGNAGDDWDKVQGGFRIDSQLTAQDSLTVQGDAYRNAINQQTLIPQISAPYQNIVDETIDAYGGNLLARLQHTFSSASDYTVQFFYDFYEYSSESRVEKVHKIDIDFQHRFSLFEWDDLIWGARYRYNHNEYKSGKIAKTEVPIRHNQLFSAFVQDEITLIDNTLWLTLGSKIEHNDYSGFEIQPTAKFLWAPHYQHRFWGGVSRAVRTPSKFEQSVTSLAGVMPPQSPSTPPVALFFAGNEQFESEQVISYELGYRTTMINNVSVDFTAFYNAYDNLRSVKFNSATFNPTTGTADFVYSFANNAKAKIYGIEISTVWQMMDWWRWDAHYSLLKTDLKVLLGGEGSSTSPQQRVSLRSIISVRPDIDLDLLFRYVDSNESEGFFGTTKTSDYISMDIRLAWRPVNEIELSVTGQNLLDPQHREYRQEAFTLPTEIERGVYGKMTWQF